MALQDSIVVSRSVRIVFFALLLFTLSPGSCGKGAAQGPAGGEARSACFENPTRACVLDQALEVVRTIGNDTVRALEIARIARAEARAGQPDKARNLLASIDDRYFVMRIVTLREIVQAESASAVTNELVGSFSQAAFFVEQETEALARAELLNAIAREEAAAGLKTEAAASYAEAFRVAQMAMTELAAEKSTGPTGVGKKQHRLSQLLSAMAADRARADDTAFAVTIAKAIKDDPHIRAHALLVVAKEQAKVGAKDKAGATLDMALQASRESLYATPAGFGMPADFAGVQYVKLLADIGQAQSTVGLDDSAAETFGQALAALPLTQKNWDDWSGSHALSYVAAAQKAAGFEEMAAETRDRALHSARAVRVHKQRVYALIDVAETQAKAGLGSDAESTFREAHDAADAIIDPYNRSDALANVAASQARTKMLPEARRSFDQAVQLALRGIGAGVPEGVLLGLARRQMEAGFADDAHSTFAQWLEAEGKRRDGPTRYGTLWVEITRPAVGTLITMSDAQSRRRLLEAAHGIGDAWLRAGALREIAELEPAP